jgi:hypothetical protein
MVLLSAEKIAARRDDTGISRGSSVSRKVILRERLDFRKTQFVALTNPTEARKADWELYH